MSENLDFENLDNEEMQHISEAALPYATATLVLGILSIVTCWLYGIFGIALGIIAIVLHQKNKAVYAKNPSAYEKSFKNSKAGFITGIIGLSLSILFLIYFIVAIIFYADIIANRTHYKF